MLAIAEQRTVPPKGEEMEIDDGLDGSIEENSLWDYWCHPVFQSLLTATSRFRLLWQGHFSGPRSKPPTAGPGALSHKNGPGAPVVASWTSGAGIFVPQCSRNPAKTAILLEERTYKM